MYIHAHPVSHVERDGHFLLTSGVLRPTATGIHVRLFNQLQFQLL